MPERSTETSSAAYQSAVSHLECSQSGKTYKADELHGLSDAGMPLLVRYDLDTLSTLNKQDLAQRPAELWRYREFLPVRRQEHMVSLGETMTPLLPAIRLQQQLKGGPLFIKDESRLPTGSFKARGLCMAVSMAKALGVNRIAMPTQGNAGAALAAYASRAGIECEIFCPADIPPINVGEMVACGARVHLIDGLIHDCGRNVSEGRDRYGWFDMATLKEPYRIEGKKTMGLELAEQLGWRVPDVILYPTGGGTGLIGMWKAFQELGQIGWIDQKRPKMVAVQATGCAPIVKAYEQGAERAEPWSNAHTLAAGIRVPAALGDFLILRALRESAGFATAVEDDEILAARDEVARVEGILLCPETAATYAAYKKEQENGRIARDDTAVLFNTASGNKYELPGAES